MLLSKTGCIKLIFNITVLLITSSLSAQTPAKANVPYGKHQRQVLDFYQAKSDKPTPLMFFVHGGGWMAGDKAKPDFLAKCIENGISVVSINYRLIPNAMEEKISPPVKACLDDSARALQFVRSKSKEWNINKNKIAGCGGSAGGFTVLWLAYSKDMADTSSKDPVARESTSLCCAVTFVPQTSLDPKQMKDWIPNNQYGNHAFALPSYDAFLNKREELMPWIKKFSPFELVTKNSPPVYLFYDSVPSLGNPYKDPPHSANFGLGLVEKLKKIGAPYEFNYKGAQDLKHPDIFSFFIDNFK